ncbi:MAG: hypothetical protein ABIP58_08295, partial [Dehalococcoidia bacterium]
GVRRAVRVLPEAYGSLAQGRTAGNPRPHRMAHNCVVVVRGSQDERQCPGSTNSDSGLGLCHCRRLRRRRYGFATVTPTAAVPTGEFPAGVKDFAHTLDRAFTQGDVDLVKFTSYSDWTCPNNYFPGAGPNCTQTDDGQGVKAIGIGAYASEGDVYDGPSYGRYLYNWIYDALRESSDEYGEGGPRVHALADIPEEYEGTQGKLGTYEIIATRIASSPVDQTPKREVLTFFVTGTKQGWLITGLQRAPIDFFLAPDPEEAQANFTAWRRWTEPAPVGSLASRWPEHLAVRKIAHLDASGALLVSNVDGSESSVLARSACPGAGPGKSPLSWSNDADRVGVLCGRFEATAGTRPVLEIYSASRPVGPTPLSWSTALLPMLGRPPEIASSIRRPTS